MYLAACLCFFFFFFFMVKFGSVLFSQASRASSKAGSAAPFLHLWTRIASRIAPGQVSSAAGTASGADE